MPAILNRGAQGPVSYHFFMAIVIQPYRPEHEPAVTEFNRRLRQGGQHEDIAFYPGASPRWLPPEPSARICNEFFVALEGADVRGGYALKTQEFLFPDGNIRSIGYYHHPFSEGIVNKAHAIVGTLLLRDAMQRAPLLYCLGMGGYENPLPQMLVRLGWTHCLIPFYFRVVNPARFLHNMHVLRTSPARSFLMDVAAYTGAGWLASKGFLAYHAVVAPGLANANCCEVASFEDEEGAGFNALWERARPAYSFTAARNLDMLRALYPPAYSHLTRLIAKRNGTIIGWAVVGKRRTDDKYGDMSVGSVVDCFALPEDMPALVRCATSTLEKHGFDLILSNQSYAAWGAAFKAAGYFTGPSNFIFAASKKLAELLAPFDTVRLQMHLTRADGDGLPRNY